MSVEITNHWTPEQALAIYEFLGELRQTIWDLYQYELNGIDSPPEDVLPPRETPCPTDNEPPF
jgi:hypothetical protein